MNTAGRAKFSHWENCLENSWKGVDFPVIIQICKLLGIFKIFLTLSQPGIHLEIFLEKPWIISGKT